jgi:hypothetical protein
MLCFLRELGYPVSKNRVQRLMQVLGLEAICPGKHTSQAHPTHPVYPYLLRGVKIERTNHVWSCDITYLPMPRGFVYLFAVIDWFSRFVLSWEISTTLDTQFCLVGLDRALACGKPAIFNSDQGSQFTSQEFTRRLLAKDIQISMDGRGGRWTTSSSNGYGEVSNTRTSICTTTPVPGTSFWDCGSTSSSTIGSAHINPWTIALRQSSIIGRALPRPNPTRKPP